MDFIATLGVLVGCIAVALALTEAWFQIPLDNTMRGLWGVVGGIGAAISLFWTVMLVRWGALTMKGEDTLMFGSFATFIAGPPMVAAVVGLLTAFG